jgi:AcrR family transcriptional regulator
VATGTQRKTADERRAEIVDAAFAEFADRGLHGTSTDAIAARAGVSQPYLFRLFGTKKDLFLAAVERCYEVTLATFVGAAEGKRGDDAMKAMGAAYIGLLSDRRKLRMQLQAQAACDDPDVREVVRRHFGELVDFVERASGADASRVRDFFAVGMLLNVIAAMDLLDDEDGWAKRFLALSRKRG